MFAAWPTTAQHGQRAPCAIYLLAAHPNWRTRASTAGCWQRRSSLPACRGARPVRAATPTTRSTSPPSRPRCARADWWCCCTRSTGIRMPPLMKLWLDEVLAFGWAYGPGGTRAARQGPVAGRDHRRPRGVATTRRLQPLLLRRLPAALRADRGAVRHALPAAAGAARRAQRASRASVAAHAAVFADRLAQLSRLAGARRPGQPA